MPEKALHPPKQQRSIEKREHIKKTALDLFSTKGYHKTTTNEIAKQAGIPVGSFYTYFQDKTALYEELVKDMYETILSQVMHTEFSRDADLPTQIRTYVEIVMKGHCLHAAFQREVASLSLQYDTFRALENQIPDPFLSANVLSAGPIPARSAHHRLANVRFYSANRHRGHHP